MTGERRPKRRLLLVYTRVGGVERVYTPDMRAAFRAAFVEARALFQCGDAEGAWKRLEQGLSEVRKLGGGA